MSVTTLWSVAVHCSVEQECQQKTTRNKTTYEVYFLLLLLNQEQHIVALNVKMLIPLAAASLAVTSCSYSLFSSVCFKFAQVLSCFWRTLNRFLLTFQNN